MSEADAPPWHAQDAEAALAALGTAKDGLSPDEAALRLSQHGPNRLPQGRTRGWPVRLLAQFHNLLIYVLLAAAGLSALTGHMLDAVVIMGVVLANAAIGFVQEGRAERALAAIRSLIDPHAVVLRDGARTTIPACDIVPGDIVLLEAGDRVPADLRLIRARSLRIDEAVLTGESVPVSKSAAAVAADAPVGDRAGMAHSGCFVAAGSGAGVAAATGADTELGKISTLVGAVESLKTPLLRQMDGFARQITFAILGVSALVFAFAMLARGYSWDGAFITVVALAVAAIPEGLPAIMTITLAIGVQRMAARKAIIRRLPAVETLGAVSVICSDKTGTLTRNEMVVRHVCAGGGEFLVGGEGYAPEGVVSPRDGAGHEALKSLAEAALLCNDAELKQADGDWTVDGDPMEGALAALAAKAGLDMAQARKARPRLDEIPFDAAHRFMATLHEGVIFVKGAPEQILSMCAAEKRGGGEDAPLDADYWRERIDALAAQGQRVLGFAAKPVAKTKKSLDFKDVENGLVLLGVAGMIDAPRAEALSAVAECKSAGIAVKMITGDHAATAAAIAAQLGISERPESVAGSALDGMDAAALREMALKADVFARASPEHKLRLVEALQADGAIVAMTGDGVNDAPALKRADVGVAMGKRGTEAAKEASEMVLADDNFASIVAAVREGRTVYDNLGKVIAWTLPTNGGEALAVIGAILAGVTLPVTPLQILWINMITAVALGLTLAFEPTEPGAMRRPPRPANAPLLTGRLIWRICFVSVLFVIGVFGVYLWSKGKGDSVDYARTLVVNAIVAMEIFYLFSVRYAHGVSLTWRGVLGTPAVLTGVAVTVAAQFLFTYAPFMQFAFATEPVRFLDGLVCAGAGVMVLLLAEIEKRLSAMWFSPLTAPASRRG
ncbi:MAG: HAD-IC family P-type ATPase [Maricaulaceae bacterium]|nr:HAD-IC family P-type ATPase [Maricaulaceae bacterium]